MKRFKTILCSGVLFTFAFQGFSQEMPKNIADRIYYGGSLGLQFGSITSVNIAPNIGYKLTPRLSAGIGITYIYAKDNRYANSYSINYYGGSIFSRLKITDNIFAHAEYEALTLKAENQFTGDVVKTSVPNLYIGGGYRQAIGTNSSFNILILYNVNESRYSPYSNPIIRLGFGVGI